MDVERAKSLMHKINDRLAEEPEEYIFEQLIREQCFLLGLITGLRNDNVAGKLSDIEGFLNDLRLE